MSARFSKCWAPATPACSARWRARRDDLAAYVTDLDGRHTVSNRGATASLAPEDYAALWTYVRRSVQEPDEGCIPYILNNGHAVLVRVSPVLVGDEPVGALVVVRDDGLQSRLPVRTRAGSKEDWSPFKASLKWLVPARASVQSSEPVLIVGESGSGKSALAAALHRNSGRSHLRVVDCAALADPADCQRALEVAGNQDTTVLLERLLDLPPAVQARLVGLLDDDAQAAAGRPWIIATACGGTEAELRSGSVRHDLLDRLAVHVVRVPPLREREDEVPSIALDIAHDLTRGRAFMTQPISDEALAILQTYAWPGNVRQLQNVVRRGLLLRPHGQIDVEALPPELVLGATEPRLGLIEQLEAEAILRTLQSTAGNVSRAAQVMGLSRATVYRRLKAYRARGRSQAP